MGYTNQSNVESRLGTALSQEQADFYSDVLEPSTTTYINRLTNTQFGSDAVVTLYVSGSGTSTLITPTIHDISSVVCIDNAGAETTVSTTDYSIYPKGGDGVYALRNLNGYWTQGVENYRITAKLGYATVPDDIVGVATELAISGIKQNLNNIKREKVGDWDVIYADQAMALTSVGQQTLESYRRLTLGM